MWAWQGRQSCRDVVRLGFQQPLPLCPPCWEARCSEPGSDKKALIVGRKGFSKTAPIATRAETQPKRSWLLSRCWLLGEWEPQLGARPEAGEGLGRRAVWESFANTLSSCTGGQSRNEDASLRPTSLLSTTLDPPRMGGNLMSKLCPP